MQIPFTMGADDAILVNIRPNSLSLTINTHTIFNFDAGGRLLGAYLRGRNYLRGLDNRVLVKWGAGHGLARRSRCDLDGAEKRAFFAEMAEAVRDVRLAIETKRVRAGAAVSPDMLVAAGAALADVQGYDQLEADALRFRAIYKPISILPPDQYLAVVLQATEGCSWNQCTFCDFYRDRPFHIKSVDEFRSHMRNVREFFGRALSLRTTVFLADANALVIPQRRLMALLDVLHAELDIVPAGLDIVAERAWLTAHPGGLRGIFSFVDAFSSRHKSAADFRDLAQRSLRRVYIGLESGDDDLLRFLHKGSSAADACATVAAIKAGGVDVGVIIMAGAGGKAYAAQHVKQSTAVLNAMNLGEHDIVYFSPFMDYPGSAYGQAAALQQIAALSSEEMDAQIAEMRSGLRFADPQRPPKIATYDIREFIY